MPGDFASQYFSSSPGVILTAGDTGYTLSPWSKTRLMNSLQLHPPIQTDRRVKGNAPSFTVSKRNTVEVHKGFDYLRSATQLYTTSHPGAAWYVGLAGSMQELLMLQESSFSFAFFCYFPPSGDIHVARRIRNKLLLHSVLPAGGQSGALVYVFMKWDSGFDPFTFYQLPIVF